MAEPDHEDGAKATGVKRIRAGWRSRSICLTGIVLATMLSGCGPAKRPSSEYTSNSGTSPPHERDQSTGPTMIEFPEKILGHVRIRDRDTVDTDLFWRTRWSFSSWEYLGGAIGKVVVPKGKEVALYLDSRKGEYQPIGITSEDVDALRKLPPDAIHSLRFSSANIDAISHLAGLRELIWFVPADQDVDEILAPLSNLVNLEFLVIWSPRPIDSGLRSLRNLKALKYLSVGYHEKWVMVTGDTIGDIASLDLDYLFLMSVSGLSAADLAPIRRMESLNHLKLVQCDISDGHVRTAINQPISRLSFEGSKITDETLRHLSSLEYSSDAPLTLLELQGRSVSDQGVGSLFERIPREQMEVLWLGYTQCSAAIVRIIGEMNRLQELDLRGLPVSDEDVGQLSGCRDLQMLLLDNTSITGASVETLIGFKQLRTLGVESTGMTAEDVERIRTALPECSVSFQ